MKEKTPEYLTAPATSLPSAGAVSGLPNRCSNPGLSLVEAYLCENGVLKEEMGRVSQQLSKAQSLSAGLLAQNKGLRSLQGERTRDISKLVRTCSIQSAEDRSDSQHQCHLLTELNYAVLRQIKNIQQTKQDNALKLAETKSQLDAASSQAHALEHDSLNKLRVRLSQGLSQTALGQAKRRADEQAQALRSLESEINKLVEACCSLSCRIQQLSSQDRPTPDQLAHQREQLSRRLAERLTEIQRYREEAKEDQTQLQRSQEQLTLCQDNYSREVALLQAEIRRYQQANAEWTEIGNHREAIRSQIAASVHRLDAKKDVLSQARDKKRQLMNRLGRGREGRRGTVDEARAQAETLSGRTRQKGRQLRAGVTKSTRAAQQESARLRSQKSAVQEAIRRLEEQFGSLSQQVSDYQSVMREHPNPICEIERTELLLRLRGSK